MNGNRTRLGVTALALALGGSFVAGAAWQGRSDDIRSGRLVAAPDGPLHLGTGPSLVRADSCDQLLGWYVDGSVGRVTAWGWNDMRVYAVEDGVMEDRASSSMAGDGAQPGSPTDEVTSSGTGTNVQESGVDEPDLVKTNGSILVRMDGDELTTYDVTGTTPLPLGSVELPATGEAGYDGGENAPELLLVGDSAVVIGRGWQGDDGLTTVVHRVDLADPASPTVVDTQTYDADLVSARQYGGTVRLVLSSGLPALDFVTPGGGRSDREALRKNRQVVRDSTIDDWLPTVRDGGGAATRLVGCDAMRVPADFSGPGAVAVVGYAADAPRERSVTGVATSSNIVYSSTDRLYLATSQVWGWAGGWGGGWGGGCCAEMDGVAPTWGNGTSRDGTTDLHAFALDGDDATYVGSGEVDGSVADRWAMDSVDGVLRVAVGPSAATGNSSSVVTFAERDGELVELGRLDGLGVDEQITSVRWFDDLAFVVTFRQTDPLYAIDLSDPAAPRKVAALKITGFSDYLHPIGDDLLLGIGTAADRTGQARGGQAAVFDIADLTAPRRVATHEYGRERTTRAGQDPRQFTWLPDRRTALTVVEHWGKYGGATAAISVLEVGPDGSLTTRLLPGGERVRRRRLAAHGAAARREGGGRERRRGAVPRPLGPARGPGSPAYPRSHVPQHPPAPQLRAAGHP